MTRPPAILHQQSPLEHDVFGDGENALLEHRPQSVGEPFVQFSTAAGITDGFDAEADFCLYLSLTIILLHNGALPLWIGIVMLLRFLLPLAAVLLSYLAFAHPVRFGSTLWGKSAGLAQCCYFLLLLAPSPFSTFTHFLSTPLLSVTICLLVTAPVAQVVANIIPMP